MQEFLHPLDKVTLLNIIKFCFGNYFTDIILKVLRY